MNILIVGLTTETITTMVEAFQVISGQVLAWMTLLSPILLAWIAYKTMKLSNTIVTLEKNTNSIKDALVKETQESYKAKGVLQEKERQEDANSSNHTVSTAVPLPLPIPVVLVAEQEKKG